MAKRNVQTDFDVGNELTVLPIHLILLGKALWLVWWGSVGIQDIVVHCIEHIGNLATNFGSLFNKCHLIKHKTFYYSKLNLINYIKDKKWPLQ